MGDLLLVENDARILELMTLFLAKAGHSVRGAASFELARAAIRERTPDLMLSDLEMGAESGREALPDLAREGLLPPTLVVSGYLDRPTAEAIERLPNVVGTLAKPYDMKSLLAKVDACLA